LVVLNLLVNYKNIMEEETIVTPEVTEETVEETVVEETSE
jgi:hypothetical protein